MFKDNLRQLRKEKRFTQEELAIQLNVVRQTVSKWEKGLSVPDVEMLSAIADVLETDIGTLLGKDVVTDETRMNETAVQLGKISEQLAIRNRRNRRICRIVGAVLAGVVLVSVLSVILNLAAFHRYSFTQTENVSEEVETHTEGEADVESNK